ncbi:hypothetical protein [Streptomyces sp. NPDC002553]|uniref:hypothetical protein n=1 Tax=Streptomyces sp. NPDC002553 TaxID=3154417 RepID=UPI003328EB81
MTRAGTQQPGRRREVKPPQSAEHAAEEIGRIEGTLQERVGQGEPLTDSVNSNPRQSSRGADPG